MRLILCVLMIAAFGGLFWQATGLDGRAAVYPMFVTGGALIFSIAYTLRQAIRGGGVWPEGSALGFPDGTAPRVLIFVAIWSIYVLALPRAGFIAATWVALVLSIWVVRRTFRLADPLWMAVFTVVLTVLLKVVLYVPVPQGWLDVQLEILIYSLR